ncbi:MAG: C10 family peptidase [Bacteroidales bacterium]|nr:C10 family peptidase [Bacteroidales bacterium]
MKKSFLLVTAIILANFIFAQITNLSNEDYYVSSEQAKIIGVNFHAHQAKKMNQEKYGKANYSIKSQTTLKTENGLDCIHVYNFNEDGFVLVSADIRATPVLAYSNEGQFDYNNMAPATKSWIEENYMPQFEIISESGLAANEEIIKQWNQISKNDFSYDKNNKGVDIIVETRWNQNAPYNMYCPEHSQGPGGRVYAGCVATAMSQVMKYWNYPETGKGSQEFFWGEYLTADYGETEYRWDEMTISANTLSREAIAELMYHCGVSVYMNWGYDGSGTSTQYAASALKLRFKYRTGVYYQYRDTTPDAVWKFTIKEDLDKGHPIIYDGDPGTGEPGHAFVCDGYQDTSYFHFNWGWGGSNDGFFFIDNLNPSNFDFKYGQGAVLNITPIDADFCKGTTIYTQPEWSFGDGSGDNYYFNNTTCNWIINPDVEDIDLLRLTFTKFELTDNDVLKVYKGHPLNSGLTLIDEYTSTNRPYSVDVWGGDKLYLIFETNSEGQAEGWEAYYTTFTSDINDNMLDNISIYPNPANNNINITGITNSNVAIYDIYGKLIKNYDKIDSTTLDISDMSAGIYFINVSNNDDIKTIKFVKK